MAIRLNRKGRGRQDSRGNMNVDNKYDRDLEKHLMSINSEIF